MKRLLLIADTSIPEALGSKLLAEADKIEIIKNWSIEVSYHSPATIYSPSMKYYWGKLFYRLNDKRSWEWRFYQRKLFEKIKKIQPEVTLVTGILPLKQQIFEQIRSEGGVIANYLTDDPWNPIHKRNSFLTNLPSYDHIFSTKRSLQKRLRDAGAPSTSWLPFAYDPTLHYEVKGKAGIDIVFVGTGAKERLPWLEALSDVPNLERRICGNGWGNLTVRGWQKSAAVTGDEYCRAINGAGIVLGLLRRANGDQSTDRSYEIGAIGGCGLYQDTEEHRRLLPTYPDVGFFKCPKELRDHALQILRSTELQETLRRIGSESIRRQSNRYSERLKTILEWGEK